MFKQRLNQSENIRVQNRVFVMALIVFIAIAALSIIQAISNNLQKHEKINELVSYLISDQSSSVEKDSYRYENLQYEKYFEDKIIDEINKYSGEEKWNKLNGMYDYIYNENIKSSIKEMALNYLNKEKETVINTTDFSEIQSYIYKAIEYNEKFSDTHNEFENLCLSREQLISKISELLEPIIVKDGLGGYYDDKKDVYKGYNNSETIGVVYHADISSYEFYGDILVSNSKEYWQDLIQDENTALNQKMLDNNGSKDITIYYCKGNSINIPDLSYFNNIISSDKNFPKLYF